MIESHRIPASQNGPTEWRAPYGPGTSWRFLVVMVQITNNSPSSAGRASLTLSINEQPIWTVASKEIAGGQSATIWYVFDGDADRYWVEGAELRELVSMPRIPALKGQAVKLTLSPSQGIPMDFSGIVYVERLDDPSLN